MVKFERIDESTVGGQPVMFTRYSETAEPVQIDLVVTNSAIRIPLAKCKHIYTVSAWGINKGKETNDFDTHNLFLDAKGKLLAQVQRSEQNYQIQRGEKDVTKYPNFFCSPDQGIRGRKDRSATQTINGQSFYFCNAEYSEIYMPAHDVVAIGLLDFSPGSDTFAEYNPIANILISETDYDLEQLWQPINLQEPKQRLTVNFDNAGAQGNFMIFSLFIRSGDNVDIINVNKVYRDENEAIEGVKQMVKEYRKL
jgi:hypothetical protein